MGTRNLTIVQYNNEIKIAQYSQWEGSPDAMGVSILTFLSDVEKVKQLQQVLPKIRFRKENLSSDVNTSEKSNDNTLSMHNQLDRTTSLLFYGEQDFLEKLLKSKNLPEIILENAYEFAGDSLFCEWAYVIDFDKNTFEVYKGINTSGISPEDRFYRLLGEDSEYYPVKLLVGFPLDDLPYGDEFIFKCSERRKS